MRLYEHYNALCEAEVGEEGEKKRGPWRRLPSYNRTLKYATGEQEHFSSLLIVSEQLPVLRVTRFLGSEAVILFRQFLKIVCR